MFGDDFRARFRNPARPYDARSFVSAGRRRIALVAHGRRHGPITRLITPWDIGELTRPFVLLKYAEVERPSRPLFRSYPPSGITTLTVVLNGELSFEDATGKRGEVAAAGFAWMKAGARSGMRVDTLRTSRCECFTCGLRSSERRRLARPQAS